MGFCTTLYYSTLRCVRSTLVVAYSGTWIVSGYGGGENGLSMTFIVCLVFHVETSKWKLSNKTLSFFLCKYLRLVFIPSLIFALLLFFWFMPPTCAGRPRRLGKDADCVPLTFGNQMCGSPLSFHGQVKFSQHLYSKLYFAFSSFANIPIDAF